MSRSAHWVNADLPAVLSSWCAAHDALLVHFSTDYVYPEAATRHGLRRLRSNRCNEYGRSKAAGDRAILASGCRFLIFRTSWVYDAEGQNFVRTMLRLFAERDTVGVVDDQYGAPTYAPDLAEAVMAALQAPPGI